MTDNAQHPSPTTRQAAVDVDAEHQRLLAASGHCIAAAAS